MTATVPSAEARRPSVRSSERSDRYAFRVLVLYVVLLFGIPSELVLAPLGAAGTPAQLVGILMGVWWVASELTFARPARRGSPVVWFLLFFFVAMVASYVTGMSRSIYSSLETNSADRAMLSLIAWSGVVLVMADGIQSVRRLEQLLRVVAGGAVFVAVLGCLQFFFNLDIAHYIQIPGLSVNRAFGEIFDRSGYRRVSGTTAHPIEFGVVLSATLPLVIHFARFASTERHRRLWWAAVVVVTASLPLSVARSAVIGLVIVALVLFHTWPRSLQLRAAAAGASGLLAMSALLPGLLGTIKSLFLNVGSDPSTHGRTDDYAPVWQYFTETPLTGRGLGTFIPGLYRTLDNQYLGLLVETGVVGLAAFGVLTAGCLLVIGRTRRATEDESTRDLAQALKAGILVIVVDAATFDAFGFAICIGTLMVLLGAVASLSATTCRSVRPSAHPPRTGGKPRVSIATLAIAGVLLLALGSTAPALLRPERQYIGQVSLLLVPPQGEDQTAFARSQNATIAASVLHEVLQSAEVRSKILHDPGTDFEVAIGDSSLMRGSDSLGFGPLLRMSATAPSAAAAEQVRADVIEEADQQMRRLQDEAGVPAQEDIRVRVNGQDHVHVVNGSRSRALAGYSVLSALALTLAVQRRLVGRRTLSSSRQEQGSDRPTPSSLSPSG